MNKLPNPGFVSLAYRRSQRAILAAGALSLLAMMLIAATGCAGGDPPVEKPKSPYPTLGEKPNVPAYLKNTVYALTDSGNKEPYPISGYGLMVDLAGTGDNRDLPLAVRKFMVDEANRHGFGMRNRDLGSVPPELVLSDPRTAVVE